MSRAAKEDFSHGTGLPYPLAEHGLLQPTPSRELADQSVRDRPSRVLQDKQPFDARTNLAEQLHWFNHTIGQRHVSAFGMIGEMRPVPKCGTAVKVVIG